MQVLNVCIVCVWDVCQPFLYVTFTESGGGLRCVPVLHMHAGIKRANHKPSSEVI